MPYDGFFTKCVVNEISYLIDSRIDKIHQPSKNEIYLYFKKEKKIYKILLCANPSYPRVQITDEQRENPKVAPNFCMILRKHLQSARLTAVNQINFDRIIELKFESRDELGYLETFTLITEIMGKHSNIILINKNNKIVDCIKHIGCDINRYREVLPGVNYISPPTNNKLNPLMTSKNEFYSFISSNPELHIEKLISDKYLGISKIIANEVCGAYTGLKIQELRESDLEKVCESFFYYISKLKSNSYDYFVYYKNGSIHDYYIFPLKAYEDLSFQTLESCGKILDLFYGQKGLKDNLKQKFNDIFKLVTNLIERNNKKIQIHTCKLEECKDYEKWKNYGDIIMANQYLINDNLSNIELDNFYDPDYAKINIPLEVGISPVLNAQKYYKKYNKEKTTVEMVTKQLKESEEEQIYLDSISYNLENANDIETIEEIRRELSELGYIKKRKLNQKQQKSKPNHYKSSDGFDIYVGKNNVQNDYLTTKFADSNDIWMHTKNIPGSHVIIKNNGNVSDTALLEGALLAAYFSKAKNSTGVPVDYTERKNVKKPNGSKPGMVIYFTNKTAYVNPTEEKISSLIKVN